MRFMKKLSCAFLVALALCGVAAANVAYTTVDAGYTGAIGVIDEALQARKAVGSLRGDALGASFPQGGRRLYVFLEHDRTTGDKAAVYDPASWDVPVANRTWTNAMNVHGLAAYGGNLYAAAHEGGAVIQVNTSSYTATGRYYICTAAPAGYVPHAERVLAAGNVIYALFTATRGSYPGYTYASSVLVGLDSALNKELVRYEGLGRNAVDMAKIDAGRIAVACRGTGGVQVVNLNAADGADWLALEVVSADDGTALGSVTAVCEDGGGGFYFIAERRDGAAARPTLTLYRWTGSARYPVKVYEAKGVAGYACQLVRDTAYRNRVFAVMGDRVAVLEADGRHVKTIGSAELGGNPTSIAVIDRPAGDGGKDKSSSGGGCSALDLGGLALVLPLLALRRRSTPQRRG